MAGKIEIHRPSSVAWRTDDQTPGMPGSTLSSSVTIGPYKILQLIGEGGFGLVYMAEQDEPVRRRVALKIIKLGMDTKQVLARFEAERQALAMMDHSGIAKVLDAGVTDGGRPYFVMELVMGQPITSYCDVNQLSTRERLVLFLLTCQAVQHAHQKGIIHRDIKPSNILVTMVDGKPTPKVIDFGIAKAIEQQLTEKTVFTQFHQLIGTPEYMSPEQAEMCGLDIDTRSDIYSLGAVLYELLTGATPFDSEQLRKGSCGEIQRIIREVEPARPSTRLTDLGDKLDEIAKQRQAEPRHLTRLVHGDLDWIVMKCLEKDRTRRYETANGLAMDVLRHLCNEAVLASPPTMTYRLSRFVKRHRTMVIAGTAAALALTVGLIAMTLFAVHERSARAQADALRLAAEHQRDQAMLALPVAYAELSQSLGPQHPAPQHLAQILADHFRSSGQIDQAEEWRAKAGGTSP